MIDRKPGRLVEVVGCSVAQQLMLLLKEDSMEGSEQVGLVGDCSMTVRHPRNGRVNNRNWAERRILRRCGRDEV